TYTYAANQPGLYTDPLGESPCEHLGGICGAAKLAAGYAKYQYNVAVGAGLVILTSGDALIHPLRTHQQMVDSCNAGFDDMSGGTGATWEGFAKCIDNLNPIAAIRDGFHTALTSPCPDESAQALGGALFSTVTLATGAKLLRTPRNRGGGTAAQAPTPMSQLQRTGSALKSDPYHRATSWVVDDPAAKRFAVTGGDGVQRSLYQLAGEVNGKPGVFEWLVDSSGAQSVITHQRFIPGGSVTGFMNQVP
ncbi:MAG: hypothetical protein LC808_01535, partial [Actinobacteria bacterium]|nr:hypothetical protein [Actinomycetota bacterium]